MFELPLRAITHYGLHLLAPMLLTLLFKKDHRRKAYLFMLATMIVDIDHLLANPIFAPNRLSIGFHPLHSYVAIAIYIVMCFLPYQKWHLPWWWRAIGIGLTFHMLTDWQDHFLWI